MNEVHLLYHIVIRIFIGLLFCAINPKYRLKIQLGILASA